MPWPSRCVRSVLWPIAMITVSANIGVQTLSSYCGLKRLFSSKTAVQVLNSRPETRLLLSMKNALGPKLLTIWMSLSRASWISWDQAGISSRRSRQTMVTFLAPSRLAVSATSTATLPPPTTSTSAPISTFFPSAASRRKSTPCSTPATSSFSTPRRPPRASRSRGTPP